MDALYLSNKYVSPTPYDMWVKIRNLMEWICENWQLADAGIWEMRNRQEHFVYSMVMNWVALDRGIRLARNMLSSLALAIVPSLRVVVLVAFVAEQFDLLLLCRGDDVRRCWRFCVHPSGRARGT